MQLNRSEIENIVNISVQQHSQKVQFNSVIELVKPMQTNDDLSSSRPDRISIHVVTYAVTYGPENPLAKQANGVFDMPMGFHQMTRFEELNNVCVNVFR